MAIKVVPLAAALLLAGCATVAQGTLEPSGEILITSNPSGATVWQQNRQLCETPCHVSQHELRAMEGFQVRFASGRMVEVGPDISMNPNVLGNLIFGGGVGLLIDTASGRLVRRGSHVHVDEPKE